MRELSQNQRDCAGLITTLIEGELSDQQRTRLNELCRQDTQCRKLYAAVMSVHGMLLWSSNLSVQQEETMPESDTFLLEIYEQARLNRIKLDAEAELAKNLKAQANEEKKRRKRIEASADSARSRVIVIPKAAVYGGLAAAILLAAVLLWPAIQSDNRNPSPGPGVVGQSVPEARLVRTQDAVWDQPVPANGVLSGDEAWRLREGFAEIVMPSGASVILHGPTAFRLVDDNTVALDDGRIAAEVPDRAKFFTVKTRSMDVVDLGTRFGVTIDERGGASASVFEGLIEAHELTADPFADAPRKVALTAGQRIIADAQGRLDEQPTELRPDHGYIARWDAIHKRVGVQGQARFFSIAPESVRAGELIDPEHLIVFEESTVVLDQPIRASMNLPASGTAAFVTVPAGRRVVSYFLHFAPGDASEVSATLQFPGRVLGVIGGAKELRATNERFGLDTVDYIPATDTTTHGIDARTSDTFVIGGLQGDLLTIQLSADAFADQARVLVELPPDLEPNFKSDPFQNY